jgi:hypothetical protein
VGELRVKKSVSQQKETSSNAGLPSEQSEIRYNIYDERASRLGIDVIISESELRVASERKSEPLKNFWSNVSVGNRKPLKGTLASRLSPLVLAKRLGFSLCQIFELIEAGSIICRNGLIPAEEAERLLQPKIEKV